MYSVGLYIATAVLLVVSFAANRKKTVSAIRKAWKSFERILLELMAIMLFVGLLIALLDPETISSLLGESSGL